MKLLTSMLALFLVSCVALDDSCVSGCDDTTPEPDVIEEEPLPPEPEPCLYPTATGRLLYSETFPEVSWEGAYDAEGNQVTIHLLDQYCGAEEGSVISDYDSIVLAIGTGWCTYCPAYMQYIDSIADELAANNAMIIFAELQTATMDTATSDFAHEYVNDLGITSGYRVGDANTWPLPEFFLNSSDIIAYPTAFIIRTRDMRIIANQRDTNYYMDFRSITAGISED